MVFNYAGTAETSPNSPFLSLRRYLTVAIDYVLRHEAADVLGD